jgi:hypothetical protein
LITPPSEGLDAMMAMSPEEIDAWMNSMIESGEEMDMGGGSLSASLAYPSIGTKDQVSK